MQINPNQSRPMPRRHPGRRLVTAAEVAEFLSIHQDTVYRWTREGLLPVRRLGTRSIRYDLDAVEKALMGRAA